MTIASTPRHAAAIALVMALMVGGCTEPPKPTPSPAPEPPPQDRFVDLIQAGLADEVDLSALLPPPAPVSVQVVSDEASLLTWKGELVGDPFLKSETLTGVRVLRLEGSGSASLAVFLKTTAAPQWFYWLQKRDEWNSKPDRSLNDDQWLVLVKNGLADHSDFTAMLAQGAEQQDSIIASVVLVVSTEKLLEYKDLMEHDESLVPSKLRAVKVFQVESRPASSPKEGTKNEASLAVFVQPQGGGDWVYWGSYL